MNKEEFVKIMEELFSSVNDKNKWNLETYQIREFDSFVLCEGLISHTEDDLAIVLSIKIINNILHNYEVMLYKKSEYNTDDHIEGIIDLGCISPDKEIIIKSLRRLVKIKN